MKRPEDKYPDAVTIQDLKTVIIHLSGKASKSEDEIERLTLELARVNEELDSAKKSASASVDAKDKEIRGLRAELISSLLALQKFKIAPQKGNSASSSGSDDPADYKNQYSSTFDQLFQKFQAEIFVNRDLRQTIAALRSKLDEQNREIVDLKNFPKL